jgi:predicted ribosome quality control (RQC) complex YloA/Tae2 family protein
VQNNYYFLLQVSQALQKQLIGYQIFETFSQAKDELILSLYHQATKETFHIRASLSPEFTCLSFPMDFSRAKQNSVDLFETLLGAEVIGIRQFVNERCFAILLNNQFSLLFKMHGQRSNIILFQEEKAVELFNNNIEKDWEIDLRNLDRTIDQSWEGFLSQGFHRTFPTFDKEMKMYLEINKEDKDIQLTPSQYLKIQDFITQLARPQYYIYQLNHTIHFSLFRPIADESRYELFQVYQDPLEAINHFYYLYISRLQLNKEKSVIWKRFEKMKEKAIHYIDKSEEKLVELGLENRYEEIGHILMANLQSIPEKAQKITLYDFYHNQDIHIKLKEHLSPQKNAELYYRKAKNQKIEIQTLEDNINKKKGELSNLEKYLSDIQEITSLKELRKYLKNNHIVQEEGEKEEIPFRRYDCEGFEILVGKNAKNNDLLTQRYAFKEDLWLHARDVSGSHVVVKYKAGKPFPVSVIERAAELAAWYSKRKNDSLCPVIYTPKKYVRKPKGASEGAVSIEKEQVIMVVPKA